MGENEQKIELMATTLQTIIQDTRKKDGVKTHNEEGEDDWKGEVSSKKKEKEREKDALKTNPLIDQIE